MPTATQNHPKNPNSQGGPKFLMKLDPCPEVESFFFFFSGFCCRGFWNIFSMDRWYKVKTFTSACHLHQNNNIRSLWYTAFVVQPQGEDAGNLEGMEQIRGQCPVCLFCLLWSTQCTSQFISPSIRRNFPLKKMHCVETCKLAHMFIYIIFNVNMTKFSIDLMIFCMTSVFVKGFISSKNSLAYYWGVSL